MNIIDLQNITVFQGRNKVLDNFSLTIGESQSTVILGPNGSGKTSLLRIIAGLSSFETGQIDYDSYKLNSEKYKLDFLYLGHLASLSPELTCIENLKYSSLLEGESIEIDYSLALQHVGLENYENDLVGTLSAGQKKRIALSLLFISQSKVWLLDEPFSALDSNAIRIIEKRIDEHCNNGGICIFTTHQECNIKNLKEISL